MAQFFGSGVLYATPTQTAIGEAYATPTPFQFGIIQDVGLDASFDEKLLYGRSNFPVDQGRGKGKITIKGKFANVNILPFAAAFFGQAAVDGSVVTITDDTGVICAGTIAVAPPAGHTFFANLGVRSDANGTPMLRVAASPKTGEYTTDGNGSYSFAAADVGKTIFIDYQVISATEGKTILLRNQPMGQSPFFRLDLSMARNGKVLTLSFPRVSSNKLAMSTKQEDFLIPELDMSAVADDNGQVWKWSQK